VIDLALFLLVVLIVLAGFVVLVLLSIRDVLERIEAQLKRNGDATLRRTF
jgi:hypothetical protein